MSWFKLWSVVLGKTRSWNGVSIIANKHWTKKLVDIKGLRYGIIARKFIAERQTFNVISIDAPQGGVEEQYKMKFWEDLEGLLEQSRGYDEGVHEVYGIMEEIVEGKNILGLAIPCWFTTLSC